MSVRLVSRILVSIGFLCIGLQCEGTELDHRCLRADCVVLVVEKGVVFAKRTGEFSGKRKVAALDVRGIPYVSAAEAPIRYARTRTGWIAVVSAFLPSAFDFDAPELRLYIFNSQGSRVVASDNYNMLSSFHVGRLFFDDAELVQISSTGAHAYVVRTVVWLLPRKGPPKILLDVPGLVTHIECSNGSRPSGFWIDEETYDGFHAETKGHRSEFWIWDAQRRVLRLHPE